MVNKLINNNDLVKSISRSGTTFTAKNSSGTQLFTFTQQDNNTTTGTSYNAGSCPDNTTFGTNGSIKRVNDRLSNRTSYLWSDYTINVPSLAPGGEVINQRVTIRNTVSDNRIGLAIAGWWLTGSMYTYCVVSFLKMEGAKNQPWYCNYTIRNTSSQTISDLKLSISILSIIDV